jgi:pyruvate,water dikinase
VTNPVRALRFLASDEESAVGAAFRKGWPLVRLRPHDVDLAAPTWQEDPEPILRAVREGPAFGRRRREATARAMARRRALEATLAPDILETAEAARRLRSLSETVTYHVGEIATGLARHVALAVARELASGGLLADPLDIFFMERAEIERAETARAESVRAEGAFGGFERAVLRDRRVAYARAFAAAPPSVLGDVPIDVRRDLGQASFFGFVPEPASASDVKRGIAASPGRVSGRACAVEKEEDLRNLAAGDVLVVSSLAPSWTYGIARAAAIVTEAGGILSHAAIVAREMGIPCVVCAEGVLVLARKRVRLDVNGDEGLVSLAKG